MPFITSVSILQTKNAANVVVVPVNRALRFVGATVTMDGPAQSLITVVGGAGSWSIGGNTLSGATPNAPVEFFGSVNDFDVIQKRNNVEIVRLSNGTGSGQFNLNVDKFQFEFSNNSLLFGNQLTGGTILSAAPGSLATGQTENTATLSATQIGSHAHGYADVAGSLLTANAIGAHAHGRAIAGAELSAQGVGSHASGHCEDIGTLISAQVAGSMAYGQATTVGNIIAGGLGATACGAADSNGIITAAGAGSRASGTVLNDGQIFTNSDGSQAHGIANGAGSQVSAENQGALGHGATAAGGKVQSLGQGAHAFGFSNNGQITTTGTGSSAHGVSTDTSVILASADGARASGNADGAGGTITASGVGAWASGRVQAGCTISATVEGCIAVGQAQSGGDIEARAVGAFAHGFADTFGIDAAGMGSYAGGTAINGNVATSAIAGFCHGDDVNVQSSYGTAFGFGQVLFSFLGFIGGRFANASIGQTPGAWVDTDILFAMGNGTSSVATNNAIQLDKDGKLHETGANRVPVRLIVGTDTLSARTDRKFILNDNTAAAFNLNLPAGEDGLTYDFGSTNANNSVWTLVPNGGDVVDGNLSGVFAALSTAASYSMTFLGGTWYLV